MKLFNLYLRTDCPTFPCDLIQYCEASKEDVERVFLSSTLPAIKRHYAVTEFTFEIKEVQL